MQQTDFEEGYECRGGEWFLVQDVHVTDSCGTTHEIETATATGTPCKGGCGGALLEPVGYVQEDEKDAISPVSHVIVQTSDGQTHEVPVPAPKE